MIRLLDVRDESVCRRAILALEQMAQKDPEAVKEAIPKLVTLIADQQSPVRMQAVYALAKMIRNGAAMAGDSVPRLVSLLEDTNEMRRGRAAFALGLIGKNDAQLVKDAIPKLTDLLDDKSRAVRLHATGALGRIGEADAEAVSQAIPKLMAQLEDSESAVRGVSAWSLGQIGVEEALTPLRRLTIDDGSCQRTERERKLASEAIARIEDLHELKGENPMSLRARLKRFDAFNVDTAKTGDLSSETEVIELPTLGKAIANNEKGQPQLEKEPEAVIGISLSKTSFVIGSWTQVDISLENTGVVPACDCRLVFPPSMQVTGIGEVETIGPGETRSLVASIKPDGDGRLPIEVEAHFEGADGRSRKTTHTVWVDVSPKDSSEEIVLADHRPTSVTAFPLELKHVYTNAVFIGQGGFARVFRANRVSDGLTVAVKLPLYTDGDTGRSFLKEIQTWERLKHRNIVELYDMNILPLPYLETEFIENGSLERVKKPLDVEEAAEIISQVTQGVEYAHSKGVLHLDIKPGNTLIAGDSVPKLTDWGLARVKGESRYQGDTAFSPLYAAPEQISPSKFGGCDERTDIYQIGVLFYELVTGRTPFNRDDIASVGVAILMDDITPVSALNPEAAKFEGIIMKCLARHKEDRFQTATELLGLLKNHLRETYRNALRHSVGDARRSAYFCGQLFVLHTRLNEPLEALKCCLDLRTCARDELRGELDELANEIRLRMREQVPLGEDLVSRVEFTVHRIDMNRR